MQSKYGHDRVAVISTFQTMGVKQAIRDVGRMLDIPLADINRISKSINAFANYSSIEEEFAKNLVFNKEVSLIKEYEKFVNHVSKLQGLPRQYGIHACWINNFRQRLKWICACIWKCKLILASSSANGICWRLWLIKNWSIGA
nr:hypothetical protein [Mycoplasmopsis bovis]